MNLIRSLLAAVLIFIASTTYLLAAEAPHWGELSTWVGKYPTDRESANIKHLWQEPTVRRSLRTLLSPIDLKRLDSIFVAEKPIAKIDRFIVVEQCMPHNCPGAHSMVVLDTESRQLWVGIYERNKAIVSTRWYGWGDYTLLPAAILDRFRHGHVAD